MRENVSAMLQQMKNELQAIDESADQLSDKALESRRVIKGYLRRLRSDVLATGFSDAAEEIAFYKRQLPEFYKYLLYYRRVYFIEHQRRIAAGSDAALITKERSRVCQHMLANQPFYLYYRSGSTFLDERLFTRDQGDDREHLLLGPEDFADAEDGTFLTHHSYLVARMLADEMETAYLDRISGLTVSADLPGVTWTDTKVALIEVALAIHSIGAVNNGKATLADVIKVLERAFSIDLGNYSAVIQQNIRIRKKNRTAYLDELKKYVERRMDEQDEHPRFK